MQVQIDLWLLIVALAGLIGAFAAMIWAFGRVLAKQFRDGLDARFFVQDEMRTAREKALDERFQRMEQEINEKSPDHSVRIKSLEASVGMSPTRDDVTALHNKVNLMSDKISELSGEFSGVKHLMLMLNEYMVKGGGK